MRFLVSSVLCILFSVLALNVSAEIPQIKEAWVPPHLTDRVNQSKKGAALPKGENYLQNGEFGEDVGRWFTNRPNKWVGTQGHSAQGALSTIQSHTTGDGQALIASQCVNHGRHQLFDVSAFFKHDSYSAMRGEASISLLWFKRPNCKGEARLSNKSNRSKMVKGWQALKMLSTRSPSLAFQSVRVLLSQTVTGKGTSYAYWDDVSFKATLPGGLGVPAFNEDLISAHPKVRSVAAKYISKHGDETSLPYLIIALSEDKLMAVGDELKAIDAMTRISVIGTLKQLTGEDFGYIWSDPVELRNEAIKRWVSWYLKKYPRRSPPTHRLFKGK